MSHYDSIYDPYQDAFIFGSRKKRKARREKRRKRKAARKSDPKVIARTARRRDLGRKLGQAYRDIGGASAVGRAIDSLTTPANPVIPTDQGSDIAFGLADTDTPITESPSRGIPTLVYVLGGLVLVGTVSLIIIKKRKQTAL